MDQRFQGLYSLAFEVSVEIEQDSLRRQSAARAIECIHTVKMPAQSSRRVTDQSRLADSSDAVHDHSPVVLVDQSVPDQAVVAAAAIEPKVQLRQRKVKTEIDSGRRGLWCRRLCRCCL